MPAGRLVEALYYDLSLVADGMEPGQKKALALLKEVDVAADKLQAKLATTKTPEIGAGLKTYRELEERFKAGTITAEQFAKAGNILGGQFKVMTSEAIAAAGAVRAGATAAAAATVATTGLALSIRGLLAALGPFIIAMIGMELGVKLVKAAFRALTGDAADLKRAVDELKDAFDRQRKSAFDATLEGKQAIAAGFLNEEQKAARRVQELGPRRFDILKDNRADFDRAQAELAKATARTIQADNEVTEQLRQNRETEAVALGKVLEAGNATNAMRGKANILVAEYNKRINELLSTGRTDTATVEEINRLQGMVDALTAADKKAEKTAERAEKAAERLREAQQRAREGFAAATASFTAGKEDDLEVRITKLVDAAQKAKLGTAEISKMVRELRAAVADSLKRQGEALADDLRSQLVGTTITAVDDLTLALEQFDKKVAETRAKGIPVDEKMVAQLRAAKVATIELTRETEALKNALTDIELQRNRSQNDIAAVRELNSLKDALELELKRAKTAEDRRRILKEIEDIERRIRVIVDEQKKPAQDVESKTEKIATNVANIANAAFGLASAFLGVDNVLTKILGSIGQIAGGIGDLADAATKAGGILKALKTAEGIGALGSIIGGGLALGKAVFGESPEDKARRERLKENTEALRKLSQDVGDLGRNITGTQFSAVGQALSSPQLANARNTDDLSRILGRILSDLGLSFQDLAAFASALGVTIDTTRIQFEDIQAVLEAMRLSELGQFPETFAGQMAKMNAEINVFDITDPIAQFKALRKALEGIDGGGKSGILGQLIDTFDLSNPEGIAAAIAKLQELFTQVTSGAIDETLFGGLSGQDILEAIQKGLDLLRGQQAAAGTGGFNVDRTITEVTGSRMAALLSTGNIFAEMTAANTEAIARLLGGGVPTSLISAPSISPSVSSAVGGVTFSGDFTIVVQVPAGEPDPEEVGRKVARGFVRQISEGQANALSWRNRAVGNATRGTVS